MLNKVYGGVLQVSQQLMMEFLRLKGSIRHIEYNHLCGTFDVTLQGNEGQYPEISECEYPQKLNLIHRVQGGELVEVKLDDYKGNEYVHMSEKMPSTVTLTLGEYADLVNHYNDWTSPNYEEYYQRLKELRGDKNGTKEHI